MRKLRSDTGEAPALWKLDIDSAFRRIPLRGEHLWASVVAFLWAGCLYCSTHFAAPFGATSAVHAWERVGNMLISFIVRLLLIPAFRYVDDLFGAER